MKLSRRDVVKLGLGAGALPFLTRRPLAAEEATDAAVRAFESGFLRAHPIPLERVRLTGGPLKHAQDLIRAYLLDVEPDRLLAFYRKNAGLPMKAEGYGGWDAWGRQLTGHIGGHYLSAVSLMYAATGDRRFKERADYMVDELEIVQNAQGDGFLSALEGGRDCFERLARGEIRSSSFDLNGQWSPWYTLHKTYAGLRDAYRHTGNRTALEVEINFAAWAEGVLADLTESQLEHMMNTEFGGMNEVLVDLYADTGDERWLDLSYKFEHDDFVRPLERHEDDLPGTHGNTQIPKILGSVDRFTYRGDPTDLRTADFFWDTVVQHHSFGTGGHGKDEYFGPADGWGDRVDGRTAETCNVYNMLKLTRRLFAIWPDVHYADFHERALFNHILGSIDPQDGRVTYMNPVGRGVTKEYQDMFRSWTCDVGTGMESHALHGDGLYYHAGDRLFVNLFVPSTAEWAEADVKLAMDTDFPDGESARLTVTPAGPRRFTLSVRRPYWTTDAYRVTVNGEAVPLPDTEPEEWREQSQYRPADAGSSWVDITRIWRPGDVVEIALPRTLRLEATPDLPGRAAILWGPLVLAGDLGPEPERGPGRRGRGDEPPTVPVFVQRGEPVDGWLEPVGDRPGHFRGTGRVPDAEGAAREVDLFPFWALHRRTYSTYWDFFTPEGWEAEQARYAAEAERQRKLEAATVAYLEPGEAVFEQQFGYEGAEDARPNRILGRPGRTARTWFSYRIPVEPDGPQTLLLTYYSDDRRNTPAEFEILMENEVVAEVEVEREDEPRFYDVAYPIPARLVEGKQEVTLRFQAKPESRVPTIFAVRLIRGEPPE